MLRKLVEVGTVVFNEYYGIGTFKGWNDYGDALIKFNGYELVSLMRKNLTEIDETFDPPI